MKVHSNKRVIADRDRAKYWKCHNEKAHDYGVGFSIPEAANSHYRTSSVLPASTERRFDH